MIKLQDFARECGVTDRAIQKHLKTYTVELEGLYERRGPNGTWLTEEACQVLRSKMKQQPVVVGDSEIYRKNAELEQEVKDLSAELREAYKEQTKLLRQLGELQGIQAQLAAAETAQLALTEAKDEYKALADERADEAASARAEVDRLRRELDKVKNMSFWQRLRWKGE